MLKRNSQFLRSILWTFFLSVLLASSGATAQQKKGDPRESRINAELKTHKKDVGKISYAELKQKHTQDYKNKLGINVKKAKYYDKFIETFGISPKAQNTMDKLGFVVVPAPGLSESIVSWDEEKDEEIVTDIMVPVGPTDVYYRVFAADLPVFISADSILHAWHRVFENTMKETERNFYFKMRDILDAAMEKLDPTVEAERDALFYLSVARVLANHDWDEDLDWEYDEKPFEVDEFVAKDVQRFVKLVETHQLNQVDFLGTQTHMDFSLFIPRGYYTSSRLLTRYFLMMSWLGSVDLVLYHPLTMSTIRPREEAAARAIARTLKQGGGVEKYEEINKFYAKVIGGSIAVTPIDLLKLMDSGNDEDLTGKYAKIIPPAYSARIFESDKPPISMRFFSKRFAYDSWVTAQTTTPELKPNIIGGRAMAMDMDVAFALGMDRALDYLANDIAKPNRQNLPTTLEAVRRTFETIKPTEIENTVYNNWLEALSAVARANTDSRYPQVIRTDTWHDRKLEVVLSSWTELRHDTVLAVEQSSGGAGCQYPQGYVEPIPELYRSLSRAANIFEGTNQYAFDNWTKTMETLAKISEKELAGKPMSKGDLEFLNTTVDLHIDHYSGARMYNGWYPGLFFGDNGEESEPVISDVHTDFENQMVLQVGVGHPGLMIVAIDNGDDVSVYGGPVYNYYSFEKKMDSRMTDGDWETLLRTNAPAKPAFTKKYWAGDNKTKMVPTKKSAYRKFRGEEGVDPWE